jgi:hypothetical protein
MKRPDLAIAIAAALIVAAAPARPQAASPARAGSPAQPGGDAPDAARLLEKSDLSRNGWESYEVLTVIKNYVGDELKDEGSYDTFIRGDDRTLVKFLNVDVKGQYLLMLEDAMWIYMPNTRKPIRITPLQRLLGDASNGDVARTRWAGDYDAALKGEEQVDGVNCYILALTARREGATYNRADLWIRKVDARPVKAEIFLTSGKHYKTIFYDKFGEVHGKLLLTQMTIVDRLREESRTVMSFSNQTPRDIPEKYFNKDYLEKLR